MNLTWRGQPLDEHADFLVVTNNYRAYGGGHFPALAADKVVVDAPDETREALAHFLAAQPSLKRGGRVVVLAHPAGPGRGDAVRVRQQGRGAPEGHAPGDPGQGQRRRFVAVRAEAMVEALR